jgi:hypothetical protein
MLRVGQWTLLIAGLGLCGSSTATGLENAVVGPLGAEWLRARRSRVDLGRAPPIRLRSKKARVILVSGERRPSCVVRPMLSIIAAGRSTAMPGRRSNATVNDVSTSRPG